MTRGPVLARPFRPSPVQPVATYVPKDGVVDLPAGKIAAIATYLEIRAAPTPAPPGPEGRLERVTDIARYRALYARIGEPWLWFTRAVMTDDALRQIIGHPDVEAQALVQDGRDIALVELDFRNAGECELAFFGLVPESCGQGIGMPLIRNAIARAFSRPISRLWLHTCTLDHPAALSFYTKAGLTPYRRAIEIAEDPRLSGHLPRGAAPQFPIV